MSPPRRLRILCLHGFTSNGTVHAHQLRRLTAHFPPSTHEFLFPDAPHRVPDLSAHMDPTAPGTQAWADFVTGAAPEVGHRAWWFARDGEGEGRMGEFEGLEESLRVLGGVIAGGGGDSSSAGAGSRRPIDAIVGFSQGACLAGMLCALLQTKNAQHPLRRLLQIDAGESSSSGGMLLPPLAGVIFSGFRARFERYDGIYAGGIDEVPVLHVLGEKDPLVGSERSEALIRACAKGDVLRHAGGHDIPREERHIGRIVEFLRRYVKGEESTSAQALM
jgi:pimeloyl-ACP methyl ester carboxylesterase